ncbi:hypothetical protein MRX96_047015 [Rhipicephalus microplus]
MGDHRQRPKLSPHSNGPSPRRRLFHGRRQHPPPGFDGLMVAAHLQELFWPSVDVPLDTEPTLSKEPVPYYYVNCPYPMLSVFSLSPPSMVPAISCEVAPNQDMPR